MEYLWKSTGLSRAQSQRFSGVPSPSDYKYNSILILSHDPNEEVVYHFPIHSAGMWIVEQKNTFLTVIKLTEDIVGCDGTDPRPSDTAPLSKDDDDGENRKISEFFVTLDIHGAPVYCTLVSFPEFICVVSSDVCQNAKSAIYHLYQNFKYFVEEPWDFFDVKKDSTRRSILDSSVAPLLEIVGTEKMLSHPVHHRSTYNNLSPALGSALLDLETKMEFTEENCCISCGGIMILTGSSIRYRSTPTSIVPLINQIIFWRELTRLAQGNVTWFNKLFITDRLPRTTKRQSWYLLTLSRPGIVIAQLVGMLGGACLTPTHITPLIADLTGILDRFGSELRQHLPCPPIPVKHNRTVHAYRYGENRAFHDEALHQELVEEYHGVGLGQWGMRWVRSIEQGVYVGQQIIGGQVFTVCYTDEHRDDGYDVEAMFLQLGL